MPQENDGSQKAWLGRFFYFPKSSSLIVKQFECLIFYQQLNKTLAKQQKP